MEKRIISIEDIIAMNALYRPGPMDYIPDFIEGRKHPENIKYDCPEVIPILEPTYGVIVYQEQVMQIFRDLAGYSWGGSDLVRRAMSKKHKEEIIAERKSFIYGDPERNIKGCLANGISEDAANKIYDKMYAFAKYAFNKAHATCYSVTSYWTAWLKNYYCAYYLCNVMNYAPNIKKLVSIMEDAREFNINILPPDINRSGLKCTVENGDILFGLSTIKDVGPAVCKQIIAERNERPFKDFKDFLLRGTKAPKVTQALINAGAFDSMGYDRRCLSVDDEFMKDILALVEKIKKKDSFITAATKVLEFIDEYTSVDELKARCKDENISISVVGIKEKIPTKESIQKRILTAKDVIKNGLAELYSERYDICEFVDNESDTDAIYAKEKEVLGVYLSGHPIDSYDLSLRINLDDVDLSSTTVSGIITKLTVKPDKNGKKYAKFTIEDRSGSMNCITFSNAYKEYGEYLVEGTGVRLNGKVSIDTYNSTISEDESEEDDNKVYQIKVDTVSLLPKKKKEWELRVNSENEYLELFPEIESYRDDMGSTLYIIFKNHCDESYLVPFTVNDKINMLGAKGI